MTFHSFLLLYLGFSLGIYTTLLLYAVHRLVEDRRTPRAARKRRRIEAADYFRSTLRSYQRQVRFAKAYPAGVLEASARHIEMDLRDGLDRVERAARDEGLL